MTAQETENRRSLESRSEKEVLHPMTEPGRIMVVDDQPANLRFMEDMLLHDGYSVRSFPRGRLALAAAGEILPDLILLDINMPEMDGFAVCEQLKADRKLAAIPVIFLSALSDPEDKVRAFQCGGADYVTKPFHLEEVRARVRSQIDLHRLRCQLQGHALRLEETVSARTRELVEAQARLSMLDQSKNDFLRLISHELRTPLNGLVGIGELALYRLGGGADDNQLRQMFEQSRQRILDIVSNALLLTQIHADSGIFHPAKIAWDAIGGAAIALATPFAGSSGVAIDWAGGLPGVVSGDEELLITALQALLKTAVKFAGRGRGVNLSGRRNGDRVEIAIQTTAGAIPRDLLSRFFDLFSVDESSTNGAAVGLDPAVAQCIVKLFGGEIAVENLHPAGIQFILSFADAGPHGRR